MTAKNGTHDWLGSLVDTTGKYLANAHTISKLKAVITNSITGTGEQYNNNLEIFEDKRKKKQKPISGDLRQAALEKLYHWHLDID